MWLQYGVTLEITQGIITYQIGFGGVLTDVPETTILRQSGVDSNRGAPLYTRHTARRRSARWRAPEAPH